MPTPSAYGYRAKLGLIVPPTNTVNEAEWARMAPDGVTVHSARMPLHADTHTEAGLAALHADIGKAVADLRQARVDVVAYGCTAGSMVIPPESLPARIGEMAGVPGVTTAAAIVRALQDLGVRRVSVATPYHRALDEHERAFLTANGFEVLSIRGLGIGAGGPQEYVRIAETPLAAVDRHARESFVPGSDALLITCTDFPTLPLLPALEADLGVPVVTSNQATFRAAVRAAGVRDRFERFGRLLRDLP
jgi:maleate isomerase/arylmalonate decarboxylase